MFIPQAVSKIYECDGFINNKLCALSSDIQNQQLRWKQIQTKHLIASQNIKLTAEI